MFRNLLIMLILAALLAACAPAGPSAQPTPAAPGVLPTQDVYPPPPPPAVPGGNSAYPAPPSGSGSNSTYPAPESPLPGDKNMVRANIFIDSADILILESFPPQFNLVLEGSLPTPCHQLQYQISEPDAQNRIVIEVFTVVDPGAVCIQVIQPFNETISLGSFPDGTYNVFVNETLVGEITTP